MKVSMEQVERTSDGTVASRRPATVVAVVAGLFLLAVTPLILVGWDRGRGGFDQNEHYFRAVVQFSRQWPRFDFSDYTSATTPGFLLYVAAAHRFLTQDFRTLRLVAALVTVGLLGHLAWEVGKRVSVGLGVALCLPMVCSLYVFNSGLYILPDNAGWWGVLIAIALAMRKKVDVWTFAGGCVLTAALVFVRQIHLWAAAVLWLAAWMGSEKDPEREERFGALFADVKRSAPRAGLMVLLTVPAVLVIAYFFRQWGGSTPARYRDLAQGGNPAVPLTVLAVFGMAGTFFLSVVWGRVKDVLADCGSRRVVIGAAVLGFVVGVVPVTTLHFPERASGIWHLAGRMPIVAERSVLMVVLSTWGAAMLALFTLTIRRRDRWLFLGAWVAFVAAQSASFTAWQRYYEPFAFMMLAVGASLVVQQERRVPRWGVVGPITLAMLSAAVTVVGLR